MLYLPSNSVMSLKVGVFLFFFFFAFFVILGTDCNISDLFISMENAFEAWDVACDAEQLHEALGK